MLTLLRWHATGCSSPLLALSSAAVYSSLDGGTTTDTSSRRMTFLGGRPNQYDSDCLSGRGGRSLNMSLLTATSLRDSFCDIHTFCYILEAKALVEFSLASDACSIHARRKALNVKFLDTFTGLIDCRRADHRDGDGYAILLKACKLHMDYHWSGG